MFVDRMAYRPFDPPPAKHFPSVSLNPKGYYNIYKINVLLKNKIVCISSVSNIKRSPRVADQSPLFYRVTRKTSWRQTFHL